MDEHTRIFAKLEALLFIHGEPLSREKIFAALAVDDIEGEEIVKEYVEKLKNEERGLSLVASGGKVQLVTKPEFGAILEQFVKEELAEDLSPASLEALAIIAYHGPVSKSRIEYLRGVSSSFILRSLLLRGLIERVPDPARPASYVYSASIDLLKYLGVSSREDLPKYREFRNSLESLEKTLAGTVSPQSGAQEGTLSVVSGETAKEALSEHIAPL